MAFGDYDKSASGIVRFLKSVLVWSCNHAQLGI